MSLQGGSMRNEFLKLIPVVLLSMSFGRLLGAQNSHVKPEKQQLKDRQKIERKLLNAQESNTNKALNQARISPSQRAQVRHQMKREKHQVRDRQHEEMQNLKDRERVIKERSGRS